MTQAIVASEASGNAARSSGRARAMIVISRLTMNPTSDVTASVSQARRSIRVPSSSGPLRAVRPADTIMAGAGVAV